MKRREQFRSVFAALAVVGIVGMGTGYAFGVHPVFPAFCGVVGIGSLVVLRGGERYVTPITFFVSGLAALSAACYLVQYRLELLILSVRST